MKKQRNKVGRDKLGRYKKGFHHSEKTEFKKNHRFGINTRIKKGKHLSKHTEFKKIFSIKEKKQRKRDYQRRWRKKNKEKVKCQVYARKIIMPKKILCQECNKRLAKIKHHEDYSKPLVVKFVCYSCHNKKIINRGKFAKEFHNPFR
jgi:hypothetical protein